MAMMKLRCVVEHITYQNQENGYSVMRVKVKDYADLVTLVGNLLDVPVGAVLLCDGVWKMDKRYGRQFVCETWEEVMPATVYGIEKYLGSGLVKGIGPKFAHLIVERFGTETIDIIEEDIERLYEVPDAYAIRNLTVNTKLKERLRVELQNPTQQPNRVVMSYRTVEAKPAMAADPATGYTRNKEVLSELNINS